MKPRISWQWRRRLIATQNSAADRTADARLAYELATVSGNDGLLALAAERQIAAARYSRESRKLLGYE